MSSRTLTQAQFVAEARARFGYDTKMWAFKCPNCGDVATPADFVAAGADAQLIGQDCIGRHLGALSKATVAVRGCNWAAYGLFRGPWFVEVPDGNGGVREVPSFPLAPAPTLGGPNVWQQRIVDVLAELVQAKTMTEIAAHLGLSLWQTKDYLARAIQEFGARNRTNLVHIFCRKRILPLDVPRATVPRRDLGPQETRVLHRLAEGDSYAEIGVHLHLAVDTIKTYMTRALNARGATTAAQLVYLAHVDGLPGCAAPGPVGEAAGV